MDALENYRRIIESILTEHSKIRYAHGEMQNEALFDRERDRYALITVGWDNGRRVHGALIHIDIINGKLWIQRDGTEYGVAKELVEAGVPKDHIVLAFRPAHVRPLTEFAVA